MTFPQKVVAIQLQERVTKNYKRNLRDLSRKMESTIGLQMLEFLLSRPRYSLRVLSIISIKTLRKQKNIKTEENNKQVIIF